MAGRGRTGADERLAAELAAGKTVKDAAISAGIAERTAFRRLTDSAFAAQVSALRGEMVRAAAGQLVAAMGEAADVLRSLLSDPDARIRLGAAVKLLDQAVKVTELSDLQKQVEELERRVSKEEQA
ncbi:MAG: hypothetical protein K8U57_28890 [Planctomycetes bacterium]|nr:hypothetical protein [Planctomycetota bacterium]